MLSELKAGPPFLTLQTGPPIAVLHVARGTIVAGFGAPVAVSDPAGDAGPGRLAVARDGSAALVWSQAESRYADRRPQAALAAARGVAIDGGCRAVLAWASITDDVERILATAISPSGIAGPSVVAQSPLVHLQGRAAAIPRQVLRIRATERSARCCGAFHPDCRVATPCRSTRCRHGAAARALARARCDFSASPEPPSA